MRRASIILLSLGFALGACGGTSCSRRQVPLGKFGWPKFFAPGPAPLQQQNAAKFDPYAEYGPALGESRPPRGAGDQPLPEAARGRWDTWGAPRYGYDVTSGP